MWPPEAIVVLSAPSGRIDKTSPSLRLRKNRRSLAVLAAAAPPVVFACVSIAWVPVCGLGGRRRWGRAACLQRADLLGVVAEVAKHFFGVLTKVGRAPRRDLRLLMDGQRTIDCVARGPRCAGDRHHDIVGIELRIGDDLGG